MTEVYTQGYEDGAYRLEQVPTSNVWEKASLLRDDIEGAVDWLYLEDASEYTKGWADGYSNSEPSNR